MWRRKWHVESNHSLFAQYLRRPQGANSSSRSRVDGLRAEECRLPTASWPCLCIACGSIARPPVEGGRSRAQRDLLARGLIRTVEIVLKTLWLLSRREPDILDDHEQMPRIDRRRREAKVPVERDGAVVFGMNGECAHADHVGDLQRAPERIEQQPGTNAAALRLGVDG